MYYSNNLYNILRDYRLVIDEFFLGSWGRFRGGYSIRISFKDEE